MWWILVFNKKFQGMQEFHSPNQTRTPGGFPGTKTRLRTWGGQPSRQSRSPKWKLPNWWRVTTATVRKPFEPNSPKCNGNLPGVLLWIMCCCYFWGARLQKKLPKIDAIRDEVTWNFLRIQVAHFSACWDVSQFATLLGTGSLETLICWRLFVSTNLPNHSTHRQRTLFSNTGKMSHNQRLEPLRATASTEITTGDMATLRTSLGSPIQRKSQRKSLVLDLSITRAPFKSFVKTDTNSVAVR